MELNIKDLITSKQNTRSNLISIILPVYNEEKSLSFVVEELNTYLSLSHQKYNFEITFVDDRSTDNSFQLIKRLAQNSPSNVKISVVRLAKNSGSHIAITAGLNIARGEFIILMASDGQDPAEVIGSLIEEWENENDLILASRSDNLDQGWISKMLSKIAWKLMIWSTKIKMPEKGCDLLGMDKKVLNAFNRMNERNTTFIFRILSLGFTQKEIQYTKRARFAGKSNWTFIKKLSIMLDAITGYSSRPLRLINRIGLYIFIILVFRWFYVIFNIYILDIKPTELTIILNTIFSSLSIVIILLGVIGDYLWRVLDESRKRPLYEIQEADGQTFE
jgi:polyisoprenyl-phosphate glycosyltransferase